MGGRVLPFFEKVALSGLLLAGKNNLKIYIKFFSWFT
jgi:hypothetical protein